MALQIWDTSNLAVNWDTSAKKVTCACCAVCSNCSGLGSSFDVEITGISNCDGCLNVTDQGDFVLSYDYSNLDYASYLNSTHTVSYFAPCVWSKTITLGNEEIYGMGNPNCGGTVVKTYDATSARIIFTRLANQTKFEVLLKMTLNVSPFDVFEGFSSLAYRNENANECICIGSFASADDCSESGLDNKMIDLSSMNWSIV